MSAETTLRPLLAQYIHEADSLDIDRKSVV